MPIKVRCQCGQTLNAKEQLAGKRVKCPKCGQSLRIPDKASGGGAGKSPGSAPKKTRSAPKTVSTPSSSPMYSGGGLDDLFDEVGLAQSTGPRCPQCSEPLKPHAILCVNCGYNLQTGERLQPRVTVDGDELALDESYGHSELDRAARLMRAEKEEARKLQKGMPWWALLMVLLGLIGFVIGMLLVPTDQVLVVSAILGIVVAGLVQFVLQVIILVIAFRESIGQGLLVLFVPFYFFYYVYSRWDECGGLFLYWLAAWVIHVIAGIIHRASEMFGNSEPGFGSLVPESLPAMLVILFNAAPIVW